MFEATKRKYNEPSKTVEQCKKNECMFVHMHYECRFVLISEFKKFVE